MTYVGKITDTDGVTGLVGSTLYGTCATAAGTAAKVVTCADFDELMTGVTIHVKFTNGNTVASPTLNVNSTGAKAIFRFGTNAGSTSLSWTAGQVVAFTYDGTQWHINDAAGAVYQSRSTTSNYRPIMLGFKDAATPSEGTSFANIQENGQVFANENIYAKPSVGYLFAKGFQDATWSTAPTSDASSLVAFSLINAGLHFRTKYLSENESTYDYSRDCLRTYPGKITASDGLLLTLDSGGLTIVGGGESATSLAGLISLDQHATSTTPTKLDVGGTLATAFMGNSEHLILSSDNNIYFLTNCNTIANRKPVVLDTSSYFYPGTNNTGSIGTSTYKWGSVYATNINGKLYTTATNPSSETLYYIPFISGATSGNYDQLVNDGFSYRSREGSTSQDGFGVGVFGNGTASGTAGNKYGVVRIYGTGAYYSQIKTDAASSNKTVLIPNMAGNFSILNKNSTGYWGLYDGDASMSNWIRTTTSGFIPVEAGGLDDPHSSLGTSTWAFKNAYIANIYTNKIFPASGVYYNNNSGFASAPWAKTVDFTCTTASATRWYAFRVYQAYEGPTISSGLLIVSITTNADKVYSSGKVVWVYAAGSLDKDNFAVTYTNTASTSTTIAIWAKCTKRYQGWNVIPLYGGWGSGKGDIGINCYSTTTGEAAYTGTLIASEYAAIKNNAASADKLNTNAGSTKQPVYFTGGVPTAIGYTIEKNVPSNAVFTDHITTASTSGSGNAVTAISADANGALTVTKGTTFLTSSTQYISSITSSGSGNAVTALSVSNGVLTYTKGSTFLTAHPTIPVSTDTTSTASPAFGGTFTAVDSVTRDSNGHVTKINTKTVTVPGTTMGAATADNAGTKGLVPAPGAGKQASFLRGDGTWVVPTNTDTKVTQTAIGSTYTNYRPLVISAANNATAGFSPSTVTDSTFITAGIYCQPSTSKIFAKEFDALNASNTVTATLHSGGLWLKSYIEGASATYNYNETVLKTYAGKLKSNNGMLITLQGGGLTIIGGGESATSLANLIDNDQSTDTTETPTAKLDVGGTLDTKFVGDTEQLLLSSDNNIYFITACQTIANRKPVCLDTSLYFYPGTNETGSIGTSVNRWLSMYAKRYFGRLSQQINTTRQTTANLACEGTASMQLILATSSMTTGKPALDGYILDFDWDNTGQYKAQLSIPDAAAGSIQWRPQAGYANWDNDANLWRYVHDNTKGVGKTGFLAYPTAGSYYEQTTQNVTGALVITLPFAKTNGQCMIHFSVDIYNYITNQSVTYVIAGYCYNDEKWYCCTAYALGRAMSDFNNLVVRFGCVTGGKYKIQIGETTTVWKYPQVSIRDVTVGYKRAQDQTTYMANIGDWTVTFESSNIANVTQTITYTRQFLPFDVATGSADANTYLDRTGWFNWNTTSGSNMPTTNYGILLSKENPSVQVFIPDNASGIYFRRRANTTATPTAWWGITGTAGTTYNLDNFITSYTDEKVKITTLAASTAAATYMPTFVAAAGTSGVNVMSAIKYGHNPGTTSAVGNSRLILGNATAEGSANNEQGLLRIYSAGTAYHTLYGMKTNTNIEHALPTVGGTLINSGCVGTGLTWDSTNNALNHSSSVTAVSTAELKKLTYNASGHITGKANIASTDVDSLLTLCPTDTGIPNDNTYYISQSTAGTDVYNRRSVKYLWQYMFDKVVATYYNNNSGFADAPWAKVASTTITSGSAHRHIEFLVGQAFRDSTTTTSYFWGILAIRFNTTSSKVYGSGQVEWLVAHENLDKDNIVVTYTNVASTSTTIEIWAKTTVRYCGYTFRSLAGLGLGIANAIYTDWTFYDPTSGVATYTGTLITSSYSNLKNNAANVTGTVAIANGGTGATSRLNALKALTNESVGTNAQYFLTITTSWGKGGFTSVADAKTVLGLKSAAYTESSAYLASSTTYAGSSSAGGAATSANKLNTNAGSATKPVYFSGGVPVVTTAPASGAWFSSFTGAISSTGVMEVGRYLDFHSTNTGTTDYDVRLDNASTTSLRFGQVSTTAGANFSPATTAKYDLGTSSLKWRYIYGDLNGKINITAATDDTYYLPFISSTSGYNTLSSNTDISFETSRGDTSSTGLSLLGLGNSTAEGSNGNAYGALKLYGLGSNYISLTAKNVTGSNKEIKLPNYAGTVMVTGIGDALTSANSIDADTKDITKHWYVTNGATSAQISDSPAGSNYGYHIFNIPTTAADNKYQKQLLFGNTSVIPYMYRYLANGTWSGGWRSPGTGFFYVLGTQNAKTKMWTGNLPIPQLYDGLTIAFYLPYDVVTSQNSTVWDASSNTNVWLQLTLSNGQKTDWVPCYWTNQSRITTHFSSGATILLTYWSTPKINGANAAAPVSKQEGGKTVYWPSIARWTRADYNSNSDTKVNVTLGTTTKAYLLGTSTTPTSTAAAVTTIADTGVYLDTTAGSLAATKFTVNNLIEIHDTSYTSRSVRLTYASTASGTAVQHFPTCDGEIQVSQGQLILYSGTVNLTSTSGADLTITGDFYLEDFRMLLFELYPPSGDGSHHIIAPWNYVYSQSPTVIWFQAVPEQNTSHMSTKSNFSVGVSYTANGKIHITPGSAMTGTWGIRIYSLI